MSDETWRGIIIRSIPPTTNWLPVIPSLYTMATSADIISTLSAHEMILRRGTTMNSTSTALAANKNNSEGCENLDCKAKDRSTHKTKDCYWPGGGKEGQFPPDFGVRSRASVTASNPEQTGHHFALSARVWTRGVWTSIPGRHGSGILIGTLTDPTETTSQCTSHTGLRRPTSNFITLPTPDKTSLANHFLDPDLDNPITDSHHHKRELDITDSDAPRRSTFHHTSASVGEQLLTPLTAVTEPEPITLPTHETRFIPNSESDSIIITDTPINNQLASANQPGTTGISVIHWHNPDHHPCQNITNIPIKLQQSNQTSQPGLGPNSSITKYASNPLAFTITSLSASDTKPDEPGIMIPNIRVLNTLVKADSDHAINNNLDHHTDIPGTGIVDITATIPITAVITVKSNLEVGLRCQSTENEQREIMGEPGEGEGQPSQDWATTDLKPPQTNSEPTINWSLTSYYYYARATGSDDFIQLQVIHPNCDVTPDLTVVSTDIKPLLRLTSKSYRHHATSTQASAIHTEPAENNKDYPTNHLPSPAISPLTTILLPTTHWQHLHRDRNSIGMKEYGLHDNKAQKAKDMGEIQWRNPRERGNLGMDNNFVDTLYNPDPPHPDLSAAAPTYQRRHPPPLRLAAGGIFISILL